MAHVTWGTNGIYFTYCRCESMDGINDDFDDFDDEDPDTPAGSKFFTPFVSMENNTPSCRFCDIQS